MKLIDKFALVAEIEKRIKINKECMLGLRNLDYYQGKVDALNDTISFLDTLETKDVDLEKATEKNLWKPADGDDLPEVDREVIVLIEYNAQRNIHDDEYPTYRVGFGHRPNPDGWDGKNIDTNEVTHYTPKLYNKGGWNAPDIVYWLDVELPKEIEL